MSEKRRDPGRSNGNPKTQVQKANLGTLRVVLIREWAKARQFDRGSLKDSEFRNPGLVAIDVEE